MPTIFQLIYRPGVTLTISSFFSYRKIKTRSPFFHLDRFSGADVFFVRKFEKIGSEIKSSNFSFLLFAIISMNDQRGSFLLSTIFSRMGEAYLEKKKNLWRQAWFLPGMASRRWWMERFHSGQTRILCRCCGEIDPWLDKFASWRESFLLEGRGKMKFKYRATTTTTTPRWYFTASRYTPDPRED